MIGFIPLCSECINTGISENEVKCLTLNRTPITMNMECSFCEEVHLVCFVECVVIVK